MRPWVEVLKLYLILKYLWAFCWLFVLVFSNALYNIGLLDFSAKILMCVCKAQTYYICMKNCKNGYPPYTLLCIFSTATIFQRFAAVCLLQVNYLTDENPTLHRPDD